MEELDKKSVADLEKIFFDIFGISVHAAGTYPKERIIAGILAARERQKQGDLSISKKQKKETESEKYPFSKGHYHYPSCWLDTEENFKIKSDDCKCIDKMDTHTMKLQQMAEASSKGKTKSEKDSETKSEKDSETKSKKDSETKSKTKLEKKTSGITIEKKDYEWKEMDTSWITPLDQIKSVPWEPRQRKLASEKELASLLKLHESEQKVRDVKQSKK